MLSYYIKTHEHSLLTNQAQKEPVKEVSNLLSQSKNTSWNDLQGLTWDLFEEANT